MDLTDIIAAGESEVVDFKASFGKEAVETLCAFANHKGGMLLVGVDDSGQVVGIDHGPETIQRWANQVKQSTSPAIIPDIELVDMGDKQVAGVARTGFECRGSPGLHQPGGYPDQDIR